MADLSENAEAATAGLVPSILKRLCNCLSLPANASRQASCVILEKNQNHFSPSCCKPVSVAKFNVSILLIQPSPIIILFMLLYSSNYDVCRG
jgi:hypothetical protein